jgi:hypothetical protein
MTGRRCEIVTPRRATLTHSCWTSIYLINKNVSRCLFLSINICPVSISHSFRHLTPMIAQMGLLADVFQ